MYGDFSKHRGNMKKAMSCFENALKYIDGEVKQRETNDKLDSIINQFDKEKKSLLAQMKNESHTLNQIAATY
jgi:flagellar biosynthesis regulator FlbT